MVRQYADKGMVGGGMHGQHGGRAVEEWRGRIKHGRMCFVDEYSSFLQQISMSATITMVAVHKPVPTQMVHFSAVVDLGLD